MPCTLAQQLERGGMVSPRSGSLTSNILKPSIAGRMQITELLNAYARDDPSRQAAIKRLLISGSGDLAEEEEPFYAELAKLSGSPVRHFWRELFRETPLELEQSAPSDEAGPEDMDELADDQTQPVLTQPYHTVIWRGLDVPGPKSGYEQIQEQLKKDAKEVKL